MIDAVEDELRALLQGRASRVADARDPVAGVESGVRRVVVRRRLAVTAGVPLLVGAVVGGAGLLSGQSKHDSSVGVAVPAQSAGAVASVVSSPAVESSAPTSSAAATPASDPQAEVYRSYLETDPMPRELAVVGAGFGGRPYCALRVLDQSSRYAYLWVYCNEYYLKDGVLAAGSADSVPVRLTISGTGAATRVLGAATPHSGAPERAELKALFSPLAFNRSLAYSQGLLRSPGVDESAAQLKARAVADVHSGRLTAGNNTPAS